jgi:hypothetical protein
VEIFFSLCGLNNKKIGAKHPTRQLYKMLFLGVAGNAQNKKEPFH